MTNAALRIECEVAEGGVSAAMLAEILDVARAHPVVAAFVALEADPSGPHALRNAMRLLGELAGATADRSAEVGS